MMDDRNQNLNGINEQPVMPQMPTIPQAPKPTEAAETTAHPVVPDAATSQTTGWTFGNGMQPNASAESVDDTATPDVQPAASADMSDNRNADPQSTANSGYQAPYGQPYAGSSYSQPTGYGTNPYQVGWQNAGQQSAPGSTYSAQWNQPVPPAPPKPKKEKKPKKPLTGGKIVALCLVCCLVFSAIFGVGGVFLGQYLTGSDGGGKTIFYQQVTPQLSAGETSATTSTSTGYSVGRVAELASPSVVEITTEQMTTGSFMQQYVQKGAGSGVIVSQDGYIVTNNHVIEGATTISVRTKNGDKYTAKLIGTDSQTDIAVIKVEATKLTPAVFGDSDTLKVGDMAVAIGNPLGELGGTVTDGIISALDREVTIDNVKMTLLQTNAAVNPGNSGGGLFNSYGALVAVVNAKSSGNDVEGLGFAIPINIAKPVIESLISYGYVKGRPFVGVTPVDILDAQTAMSYRVNKLGVYVLKVSENSPASKAGLTVGDCLLSIGNKTIESASDLSAYLLTCKVGQTVQIKVQRGEKTLTLSVTLAERSAQS